MTVVLAVFAPAAVVYAVLRRPWHGRPSSISRAFGLALAPGLAFGLASCVYFVLLLATSGHARAARLDAALWSLAVAMVAWDGWARRRGRPVDHAPPADRKFRSWRQPRKIAAGLAFVVVAALAAWAFGVHVVLEPHGEWDAWAVWNLRARSLLRGAPDWAAIFSPEIGWSSPDYPLLVPLTIARLWVFTGSESTSVPILVAATFFLGSIATIVVSLGEARGWTTGLLGGAVLLVSRTYVFHNGCQCGDGPLAFFLLVAVCSATIARQIIGAERLFFVSGLAAGLAAWTKNEGTVVLALVVVFVALSPIAWASRRWALIAIGAALPVLALGFFKLRLSITSNYLVEPGAIAGMSAKLGDIERWSSVVASFVRLIPRWGDVPGGALLSAVIAVAATGRADRESLVRALSGVALVSALTIGYMLVYVVTPLPLEWQISVSLSRLLAQLWPTFVWALFQLSDAEPRGQS